jgi:hypothetical protein
VTPASPSPCDAAAAGGGCGGSGFGGFGPGPVDGVEVYDRGVVGPYETVTLGSDDPNALFAWLAGNGFAYPAEAIPILEHYTALGSAFVVLRLRPGADVSAMQPVRLRFRGFMGTFPLRMVVVGATGSVDLSLWVIAEQRYAALNYPTVEVDDGELAWDWSTNRSNYDDVFEAAIARSGGRAWVTEYAAALGQSELAAALADVAAEDFAVAGARVHYPYLTRLRTRMLVEHISEDLQLAPAEDASDVSREHVAARDVNYECADGAAASGAGPLHDGRLQSLLLVALALAAGAGRRSRRLEASAPSQPA